MVRRPRRPRQLRQLRRMIGLTGQYASVDEKLPGVVREIPEGFNERLAKFLK